MKRSALVLMSLLFLMACSTDENNLEITGKVEGLKKGTLFLQKIEDTTLVNIDSVVIRGQESFRFETEIGSPQVLYLYLRKKDNSRFDDRIMFFAEPGEMVVNTTLKNFETDVVVEGSENQRKLMEYKEMMKRFNEKNLELIQKDLLAQKAQNEDSIQASVEQYENLLKRRYLYTVNFAINNKDYEVAPYLAISEVYDANIKYLDTIYNSLTPKVKESKYGRSLQEFLKERRALLEQQEEPEPK